MPLLDRDTFFVREHVAVLKLTDTYDILDVSTGEPLGQAREEPGGLIKVLRLLVSKRLLPTLVNVYERDFSTPTFSLRRGFSVLRARVVVSDRSGTVVGELRSKLFSLGGGFWVHDAGGSPLAEVRGDWKGWNFKLLATSGQELGTVTKKWAGAAKELFTSADNYVVALGRTGPGREGNRVLLLAAALAIDLVFKER